VSTIDPNDHMGLVKFLADKMTRKYGGEFEEWLGHCWEAIYKAAKNFKPELGFQFSTYASKAAFSNCQKVFAAEKGAFHNKQRRERRWLRAGSYEEWMVPDESSDPALVVERQEEIDNAAQTFAGLCAESPDELASALLMLSRGLSCTDISFVMGKRPWHVNQIFHHKHEIDIDFLAVPKRSSTKMAAAAKRRLS
jgi:hypothetical protein